MKDTHRTIFRALEIANLATGRAVAVEEVVKAMTNAERTEVAERYPCDPVGGTTSRILAQLLARRIVFSIGKVGGKRLYASPGVFSPEDLDLRTHASRRQRTLSLARACVETLQRPVRLIDLAERARSRPDLRDLTKGDIAHDLSSLAHTGEMVVVRTIRGGGADGSRLYLPAGVDPEQYAHREPLTWLEEVAAAFEQVWVTESAQAESEERRPRPVATGAVRAYLAGKDPKNPGLADAQVLVNAMQSLATGEDRILRKVQRPGAYNVLWAPINTMDGDLDLGGAYGSDQDRVAEAVRRAAEASGVPAVPRRRIQYEVELDPGLIPAGSQAVHQILSDAAKEKLPYGNGERRPRIYRRVARVGRVAGEAYYACLSDGADPDEHLKVLGEARGYVQLLQLQAEWDELRAEENLRDLEGVALPTVLAGRTLLIHSAVVDFAARLGRLAEGDPQTGAHIGAPERGSATFLLEEAQRLGEEAAERLMCVLGGPEGDIPDAADPRIPGWTATELWSVYAQIYPRAMLLDNMNDVVRLFGKAIHRIPNPEFQSRKHGSEFLFDRTDALFYAAKQWGGRQCMLFSALAETTLGSFRDWRFVQPALRSPDPDHRLAGVACVAFLWEHEAHDDLRTLASCDPEPGIRHAALWAHAFSGGLNLEALSDQMLRSEPDARSQSFVAQVQDAVERGAGSIWAL